MLLGFFFHLTLYVVRQPPKKHILNVIQQNCRRGYRSYPTVYSYAVKPKVQLNSILSPYGNLVDWYRSVVQCCHLVNACDDNSRMCCAHCARHTRVLANAMHVHVHVVYKKDKCQSKL